MLVGVPAGTTTAVHVLPSTSGNPASAMDGISGNVGDRVLPVTARARSLLGPLSPTFARALLRVAKRETLGGWLEALPAGAPEVGACLGGHEFLPRNAVAVGGVRGVHGK